MCRNSRHATRSAKQNAIVTNRGRCGGSQVRRGGLVRRDEGREGVGSPAVADPRRVCESEAPGRRKWLVELLACHVEDVAAVLVEERSLPRIRQTRLRLDDPTG